MMPTQSTSWLQILLPRLAAIRYFARIPTPVAGFFLVALFCAFPAAAQSPEEEGAADPPGPFSAEAFQTDLFTGAARAAIPIVVPPGTAGAAPRITLRYDSGTADSLGPRDQGQWTGLGWTLDVGGFILRDTKRTASTADDTFKLVFGGASHDLVLVDPQTNVYHTKDEAFWHLKYFPDTPGAGQDYWVLTTKDGTTHRFGYNLDSKAITRPGDFLTPVAYKYLLDEATTTSGTAVRYQYEKQTATIPATGLSYDRAVYPLTVTYTYHSGSLVGPPREVSFLRGDRSDWTDTSSPTNLSFFGQQRLDAIEVRVGSNLVRKYVFSYDEAYALADRDPNYTWAGGATGDLILTRVIQYGTGTYTLPPLEFTYYPHGRMASASNGIGGTVSYAYERIYTAPLYKVVKNGTTCVDWGVWNTTGWAQCQSSKPSSILGYTLQTPFPEGPTVDPLYSVCWRIQGWCVDFGASGTPIGEGGASPPTFLGYAFRNSVTGTNPVYHTCLTLNPYTGACSDWAGLSIFIDYGGSPSYTLLGYIYKTPQDRYRVTSRSVSDGRGTTVATALSYTGFALSADGKEFRGHAWVHAEDALNHHYTDTWFHQDDALKGRASQIQTHRQGGALYTQVMNTWTAAGTPYPGTTFARLDRTDVYTYDGDSSFKQTARTFEYDDYGNVTHIHHEGDSGAGGDERTEVREFFPNVPAWIVGLPGHITIQNAGGSPVAQTWYSYDGAGSFSTPPTQGRLTKRCRWWAGHTDPCIQLGYDAYGNVTSRTDAQGRTTSITYEPTFRTFPETVTTPPTPNAPGGLATSFTYDEKFGVIKTIRDPNGRDSERHYDTFGRLDWVKDALLQTKNISYDNFGTLQTQRITTKLPDGSGDGLWSEVYFDGLGRTYKVRKEAAGGVVVLETTFDNRGLVAAKTLPRFEGTSALWVTYMYEDPLRRLTRTDFPDGTHETVGYSDWITTVTDRNGHAREIERDAYGQVVRVTEPGGQAVTRYDYDALGRLWQVTDVAGNVTGITYNTLGWKESMIEPNLGTWSYGYDANGNLTGQTDARGKTLTFAYDALNRLETKTYPGPALIALTRASKSWAEGYAEAYRGGICVADGGGTCVGSDLRLEGGYGTRLGYLKTTGGTGTVPVYRSACYSEPSGVCTAWSLSLDVSGSPVAYAAASAAPPTGNVPLIQSPPFDGLLYQGQGLGTTASAYLWTNPPGGTRTDAFFFTEGTAPPEYTIEGVVGYLHATQDAGTVSLQRYSNAAGLHFYTTPEAGNVPAGYSADGTLGYLEVAAGGDLVPFARWFNEATGECLISTAPTPPPGYTVLGYLRPTPAGAGGTITFTYDTGPPEENGKGRRTAMADFAGSETYRYDALGRPARVTRTTNDPSPVQYTTDTTYTGLGALGTMTYPDGEVVTYNYDAGGHVFSVTGSIGGTYVSSITYEATGQLKQLISGNGVDQTYTYHPTTLRLTDLKTKKDSVFLQNLRYPEYDNVGNLKGIVDNQPSNYNQAFTYDALDRLDTATGPYGSYNFIYSGIGNIDRMGEISYTYGATSQTCGRLMPHAVTATSDEKSYSYDCNGNMLSDGERTFTWDADNKPVAITRDGAATTFLYSGDGARVKKVGLTKTIWYAGGFEDHVTDGIQVKHIFAGPLRVAIRRHGDSAAGTYFSHGDHLGSLNIVTNSSGGEVLRLTYLPYGDTYDPGSSGDPTFDWRQFTGQELDSETGLYFYQARYYNPVLGRFISPDPIVPNPWNPQALNRYSYVLNSPTNLVDPSGLLGEPPTEGWFEPPDTWVLQEIVVTATRLPPYPDPSIWWWADRVDLATRGLGLLRAGAGIVQMGGAAAIAGWTSGLALPLSLTVGASGALDLEVGIRQFLSGVSESSALSLVLQSAGIDPEVAELLDVARSMAGTMGAGAAAAGARGGAVAEALSGPPGAVAPNLTRAELREVVGAWDKGTFRSVADSIRYHYGEHGTGQGILEYTREARRFFELNQDLARSHLLRRGETGLKISTETYFGIFTKEGRIVTYGLR